MRLFLLALLLAAAPLARAADNAAPAPLPTTAVHGTVADATGAIIPGAEIDVLDQNGAVDAVVHADGEGNFQLTPQKMAITTTAGAISLKELLIVPFRTSAGRKLNATIAGRAIEHSASSQTDGVLLQFSSTVEVNSASPLLVWG